MISLGKINKSKSISSLVVLLILFFQLIPNQEIQSLSDQKLPEWNTYNSISVFNVISNPYQKNLVRQNQEIHLSPANSLYDKYDLTSIKDLTNPKNYYGGGLSYLQRYNTFLTVVFSTST